MSIVALYAGGTAEMLLPFGRNEGGSAVNDITMHIQTALCYLIQQRTGLPLVLLRHKSLMQASEHYNRPGHRYRRFRSITTQPLLAKSERAHIEMTLDLPSLSENPEAEAWVAGVYYLPECAQQDLFMRHADIAAWMRDWNGSSVVNNWIEGIFEL